MPASIFYFAYVEAVRAGLVQYIGVQREDEAVDLPVAVATDDFEVGQIIALVESVAATLASVSFTTGNHLLYKTAAQVLRFRVSFRVPV